MKKETVLPIPDQPAMPQPATEQTVPAFDDRSAHNLAAAYARYSELSQTKLLSPAHDAEKKGLREFFADTFIAHGGEFLGCWFTLHREYQPMLRSLATLMMRLDQIKRNSVPATDSQTPTAEGE